jgi:RNA polymerase sigma-70 factor (ECF subfamily)
MSLTQGAAERELLRYVRDDYRIPEADYVNGGKHRHLVIPFNGKTIRLAIPNLDKGRGRENFYAHLTRLLGDPPAPPPREPRGRDAARHDPAPRGGTAMNLEPLLPAARRYALFLTRDQHDADDLVQDALCRAWEKRHLFDGRDLEGWLITILRRCHVNRLRYAHTQRRQIPPAPPAAVHPSPDLFVDAARAVESLHPDFRAVVLANAVVADYVEGARRLGIKIGTYRSRLSRARAELREAVL